MIETPLIKSADAFAADAHEGQVRKYTGEPYISHPREVAKLVSTVTRDEEVIAAALLHDVVEDTPVTVWAIAYRFNLRVASLVDGLTKKTVPGRDGNRAKRAAMEVERLSKISDAGKTIKLADLICNTASIVEHDPKFARVYLKEKEDLLTVLCRGGNAVLMKEAMETLKAGRDKLKGLRV